MNKSEVRALRLLAQLWDIKTPLGDLDENDAWWTECYLVLVNAGVMTPRTREVLWSKLNEITREHKQATP